MVITKYCVLVTDISKHHQIHEQSQVQRKELALGIWSISNKQDIKTLNNIIRTFRSYYLTSVLLRNLSETRF